MLHTAQLIVLKRKPLRLKGYDYSSPGGYFLTICTKGRIGLFGQIIEGRMSENQAGIIVRSCWNELPASYENIQLDEFVIMPNHVHGIIIILDDLVGAIRESPLQMNIKQRRQMLLPKIIGRFKMNSAKQINTLQNTTGRAIWQSNYYDHVIRNKKSLERIRNYILSNPAKWECDNHNPRSGGTDKFADWLNKEGKRTILMK